MKFCPKCNETKPKSDFYKAKSGFTSYCKVCWKTYIKTTQRKPSKEKTRSYILRSKFGISFEDYMTLYNNQGGLCSICKKPLTIWAETRDYSNVACVDHNHTTGEIRGLLCNHCNTGIGLFREDLSIMKEAINYLTSKGIK